MSVPQLPFLFRVYEAAFNMKYVGQIEHHNHDRNFVHIQKQYLTYQKPK